MFEPFFTTKDVGKGSGLGLSMVYGFVKQSEGHITVDSEVGHGTIVKLYIPRSGTAVAVDVVPEDDAEIAGGSERILVVEDDESVREVVVDILGDQGYEIFEAADSKEAMALLNAGRSFDLLFTDIVLPGGMSGTEIAEKAKVLHPDIEILLATGYTDRLVLELARLDSRLKLIKKPYRRDNLLKQISSMLDKEKT